MVTLEQVRNHKDVIAYLQKANEFLGAIGYTEHGERHASITAERAYRTLFELGREKRLAELAAIAGYLHDIGNVVARAHHSLYSAVIAQRVLEQLGMPPSEIADILGAIGNHHEEEGEPVSDISSALIIADKSDVHFSRVRNPSGIVADIHDRVNYAARQTELLIDRGNKSITLQILIDPNTSSVMEYFEIFLSRMVMSRKAAKFLGVDFKLIINGVMLT